MSGAAGLILWQPHLYRALESPVHFLARGIFREQVRKFCSGKLPEGSFFRKHRRREKQNTASTQVQQVLSTVSKAPSLQEITPRERPLEAASALGPQLDLAGRLAEAGTGLISLEGAHALARYLNDTAQGEVWFEDHPWLHPVAQELAALGTRTHLARDEWALPTDTAVTLGLGVIPDLGSVLRPGGQGPAAWLPLRARRHVVLVPPGQANLNIQEALTLSGKHQESLVTWLTGPTRTADIEKILVLGAQGPAEMIVVLYHPQPPGD